MVGNDSDWLGTHLHDSIIVRRSNLKPFNLVDFDFGPTTDVTPSVGQLLVTGTTINGQILTAMYSGITTTTHITLNWTALSRAVFLDGKPPIIGLDNMNLVSIPEPSALALIASSLFALGFIRRHAKLPL
jgi:hypothetical protein